MRANLFHRIALAALLAAGPALAADPLPPRTGIDWLDWATEQVAFALREAEPPEGPDLQVQPLPPPPPADPLAATHSIETIEIHRLQQEIHLLRKLIEDEFIGRIISLESELQDIKAALRNQQVAERMPGPVVPRPDYMPAIPGEDGEPMDPVDEAVLAAAEAHVPPPAEFTFTVVDEWGRSPEVAAELGGDASTLIGLAGAVPPGSRKSDVEALMQQLRAEYEAYDNINIEIFDSDAAARVFAESQRADPAHHVASISRHRASGRDVLLYLAGEQAEAVPPADGE